MLIMRAYNCRPRDWTMKDQFDAVAENGFLTKDDLRKALRLAECPRIGALLDRCNLFEPPAGDAQHKTNRSTPNAAAPRVGSIAVGDLIAFVENRTRHQQNGCPSPQQRRQPFASSAASDPEVFHEERKVTSGQDQVPDRRSQERAGQGRAAEEVCRSDKESSTRDGGHCTTLVKHLGAVLGLRGKGAYRRPGPGQPVWRKRETLIQERIVQYTTLDEEGTVQELFETEKSQTEVLHMECKRTGEFAHSESTHYESGEAFNGEVVLEEAGVERYVHLRSVDDEYEHLESTLPSRARSGAAAAGVGGSPPTEGVESGPGENENIGDGDTVIGGGGGDSDGQSASGEEPALTRNLQERGEGRRALDGAPAHNGGTQSQGSCQQQPGPQASSSPSVPPEQRLEFPYQDGDAELNAAIPQGEATPRSGSSGESFVEVPAAAERARQHPSSPPPPSAYHYRSPSCSPRLSPRPMRSPYRQEGVGGRESSGREGSTRKGRGERERREEPEGPACIPAGGGDDAARVGRHPGAPSQAVGKGKHGDVASENDDAKTDEREGKGAEREKKGGARVRRSSSGTLPLSPQPGPVPSHGDERHRGAGARGSGGDDVRPDAWSDAEGARKPSAIATGLDESEGAFVGSGSGGGGDGGLEGVGLGEPGGLPDGYEGSVVFIDNQSHEGGNGQNHSTADEGWWQPESGSVLQGVEFAFEEGDNAPAADALPTCTKQSTTPALPLPTPSPATRPSNGDVGDHVDVSRFADELRSDSPPPEVSNPRDQQESDGLLRESAVEPGCDASLGSNGGRDQETAPAPFHNLVWGSKAAAAGTGEGGEGGKLARAGSAAKSAGNSDHSSGPDVAA
eukprot:g11003.t1